MGPARLGLHQGQNRLWLDQLIRPKQLIIKDGYLLHHELAVVMVDLLSAKKSLHGPCDLNQNYM
jgi:hypothetical protein